MSWTRLDDGFDEHGKILGFGDGAKGDARRYIWIRVLLYTNRRGHASVPWNVGETIPRASRGFLRDCVTLGLLDEIGDELRIVDWPHGPRSIPPRVRHDRRLLWERFDGVCYLCGTPVQREEFHIEHVIPLSRGGLDEEPNLNISHPVCNLRKGSRLLDVLEGKQ